MTEKSIIVYYKTLFCFCIEVKYMWGKIIFWGCMFILIIACFLLFNISAIAGLLVSLIAIIAKLLLYIIIIIAVCFLIVQFVKWIILLIRK